MGDENAPKSSPRPVSVTDPETGEAIDARLRVVAIADAEIGPQDPRKYWDEVCPDLSRGDPHKVAWCGGFALWCLRRAGLCQWPWLIWLGPGTPSGFLYRLLPTTNPQPGDIAYFAHNQHHAIVRAMHGPYVDTIDGNSIPYPEEGVSAKTHKVSDVSTFYSIASLIS